MNVFLPSRPQRLIASATLLTALACAHKADPALDPMHAPATCDTTPMKPFGRVVEIPDMHRREDFAVLTGAVVQRETGDAVEGAVVDLRLVGDTTHSARIWRSTNSKGGFSFDSLAPRAYELRVRRLGEIADTATIRPSAGRIDTLTLRMSAYRCYGY
jgi:protocatechuate 3,4-dioxygenase beta subunit